MKAHALLGDIGFDLDTQIYKFYFDYVVRFGAKDSSLLLFDTASNSFNSKLGSNLECCHCSYGDANQFHN